LTSDQCRLLDDRVADWDLANLRADRFSRELGRLIAWFGTAAAQPSPQEQRDVGLHVSPEHDGTASIIVNGPINEMVDFSQRLGASARAVKDEQARTSADVRPSPFDSNGADACIGLYLTHAAVRYAILTRFALETDENDTPRSRLRLKV